MTDVVVANIATICFKVGGDSKKYSMGVYKYTH